MQRGTTHDKAARDAISAGNKGKKQSAEVKAKKSASALRRTARIAAIEAELRTEQDWLKKKMEAMGHSSGKVPDEMMEDWVEHFERHRSITDVLGA